MNASRGNEKEAAVNATALKGIVDPVVKGLFATLGDRSAVIVMVSAPDGKHDSYYVNWAGPCLTAKGLREQGYEELQGLIKFAETIT